MAWYKTGTISVTNGSATVTGSGTSWVANAEVGEALYAPDGRLYEIINIASDTSMTITPAYLGSNQTGQNYTIVPSQSYIRDLAAQAADLVNNYSTIANTIGVGKFPDGTLADPAFKFSDDLDTGFYRSADNEVTFVAGGVAQFKYDTNGISFVGSAGLDLDVLKIDGTTVTATAAELNILDGATVTTSELNVLDGITATTAELNILDGVTATASEINKLDGASNLVEQTDIGTAPNEIPLNQYLGSMAYQDADNVIVGNLTVTDSVYRFGRDVEQFIEFNIGSGGTQALTFVSSVISQSSLVYIDISLSFSGYSTNPSNYKSGAFVFRSLSDTNLTTVQTAVTTLFSDGITAPVLADSGSNNNQFTATITNPLAIEVTAVVRIRTLSNKGVLELVA